jgi:hypothetical protein
MAGPGRRVFDLFLVARSMKQPSHEGPPRAKFGGGAPPADEGLRLDLEGALQRQLYRSQL